MLVPPSAEPLLLPESATHNRPFSLKHAQQQASIVGNMQARCWWGGEVGGGGMWGRGGGSWLCCCCDVPCLPAGPCRRSRARAHPPPVQAQGLLENAAGVTYVEYGAGKGYLR